MRVADDKLALGIVVLVKPLPARQQERSLYIPTGIRAKIESPSRKPSLSDSVVETLYPPGTEILSKHRGREPTAKLVLKPHIGRRIKIFLDHRAIKQVAHVVARKQGIVSPGTPDRELQAARCIPRVQILIGEWPGFSNTAGVEGQPVVERTGVDVQKLPEKILAHVDRRDGIAAYVVLQAAIECD